MQLVLERVSKWCQSNKMTVNAKKTKHILVLRNNDNIEEFNTLTVSFDGVPLSNVASYNYLGVDLDRNLTPKTKLTKVLKSPYYRGVSLWDMLPKEVQRATTKVRFKKQIA